MSTEEQSLPDRLSWDDPVMAAALHVARQWQEVPPEHLQIALGAMEPALKREHRERMMRLDIQRERQAREFEERQAKRQHVKEMVNLIVGAVVALGMLGAGVLVAPHHWWLSVLLCGPSLLALVKIFVLQRSDPGDMAAVSDATRRGMNAGQPPPVM